jgi:general secretion pathway protein A
MYNSYFNLDENPFSIAPDPRFLYMSEQHREALAHLMFALKSEGGFVLLTGEVGTGKTTVCRCLLEQLPGDLNVAFVLNPKLTAGELLATVCDELDVDYPSGTTSIKVLVDAINRYLLDAHAVGRRTVLIIDEAQNLSTEVLEQIRLLTNLETNQKKLLQIVMLGQPELRDLLNRPELRQLSQRITARYHLGPLNRQEVTAYIDHRLGVAGYRKKLFSEQVVGLIYRLTGGVPRLINVLCDRALLGTYVQGLDKVTTITVKNAAREVLGEGTACLPLYRQRRFLLGTALVLGIATGVTLALAWQLLTAPKQVAAPAPNPTKVSAATPPVAAVLPQAAAANQNPDVSRDQAYAELFRRWNLTYRSGEDPCAQAGRQGLACLSRKGNLGSLLSLDRPAVLELPDEQGRPMSGLLLGTTATGVLLRIDGRDTALTTAQLEKRWNGAATLLWRPPAGEKQLIKPDSQGPAGEWLAARIAQLTGKSLAGAELAQAVQEYQRHEGLLADGIAGPETIIHLDTSTGQPVPHLSRN